jgi:hypothetical protein
VCSTQSGACGLRVSSEFAAALTPESIATAQKLIAGKLLPETAQAFVDFVELCERKERETGEPVRILATY